MSQTGRHTARHLLVLGGARSGKSRYAQGLAERVGGERVFVATATDYGDPEMRARIARHQAERVEAWRTVEAPLGLVEVLGSESRPDRVVLVDCLTLWLSNLVLGDHDVEGESGRLAAIVAGLPGPVVFVSNEVGQGIVPANALGRCFRDAQGRLNQGMAEACDTVMLVAAGLPLRLKPRPDPEIVLG